MSEHICSSGNWRPAVYDRLCEVIDDVDDAQKPVAVFDFDNTCIGGDIGELFGHFLVETMRYRYDLEAFWDLIDPEDGRKRLRKFTRRSLDVAPERRTSTEAYERYMAEAAGLYGRRLHRTGKRDCYQWAVRLHVGLTTAQMNKWSTEAICNELTNPRRVDEFETVDGRQVRVERGIRVLAEIRELIDVLQTRGWEVWIVSATNQWTVRAFAPLFGVSTAQVLGNRVAVEDQMLTAKTRKPVLFREGKARAVEEFIGRRPRLVVGDAVTDYEMLRTARDLALIIDCGDEFLRRRGREHGWLFQPQDELTKKQPSPEKLAALGAWI